MTAGPEHDLVESPFLDHLATLGAVAIPRPEYLQRLRSATRPRISE